MDEPSGFDQAVLSLASRGKPIDVVSAVLTAQAAGNSSHVAVETVFTSDTHPFDGLKMSSSSIALESGPGYQAMRITDSGGTWAAVALETGHEGVYHVVSGQPRTDKRWAKLERALMASRSVSRCFLNHRDFLSIATGLSQSDRVVVSRATARKFEDRSSISRGFSESRPTPSEAIEEMEDRGGVLRTMTMHSRSITVQLRRIAGATFYSGQPRHFRDDVLLPLAEAAAARRALMSHRARKFAAEELRPLAVQLPDEIFNDRDDTERLLGVAARLPHAELAVLHRNPYLHFALRDGRDGSNFDIVVTEANSIQIFPGFRATQDALARVVQDLGERFGALAIEDSPRPVLISAAELIS